MTIDLKEQHWYYGEDLPEGWAGAYTNGNTIGFDAHFQMYNDIVDWLHNHIQRPYSNSRWAKIGDCIYVYIRKPDDYIMFTLAWPQQ